MNLLTIIDRKNIQIPGVDLIPDLHPERVMELITKFLYRTVESVSEILETNEKVSLIFPAKGAIMYTRLLSEALRLSSVDLKRVDFIIACKNPEDAKQYKFYSANGEINLIQGIPMIIDDIWDSGDSFEHISNVLNLTLDDEQRSILQQLEFNTKSRGLVNIPVLVPTTKEHTGVLGSEYIYLNVDEKAPWVTSGFGLNSGKANSEITNLERLAGVSYYTNNLYNYLAMLNNEVQRTLYAKVLESSGIECFGEELYFQLRAQLTIMCNSEESVEQRCLELFSDLGMIKEE